MVDITPSQALFSALANQFAGARQGRGQGQGSSIPGLPGFGAPESAPNVQGVSGINGAVGGGVPSTATTGPSVANSLIGGGGGTGDAIAQQVAGVLLPQFSSGEPGERGDLGAGVTGGNVGALLSVLGGIGAVPGILGSLVASDALGLPLNPSLFNAGTLADLVTGSDATNLGSGGIPFGERETFGSDPGNFRTTPNTNIGSGGIPFSEREQFEPNQGSGSGPNRGASGAGNRGR